EEGGAVIRIEGGDLLNGIAVLVGSALNVIGRDGHIVVVVLEGRPRGGDVTVGVQSQGGRRGAIVAAEGCDLRTLNAKSAVQVAAGRVAGQCEHGRQRPAVVHLARRNDLPVGL